MWAHVNRRTGGGRRLRVAVGLATLGLLAAGAGPAIAHLPLPEGPDVVQFDPGLGRIYVACWSGAISVLKEDDPQHFRKLEDFPVERKVHSLAVDVRTHRVYAPEEQEGGRPTARMVVFDAI